MYNKILTLKKTVLNQILIGIFLVLFMPVAAIAGPVIFYTDILSGPNTGGENNLGAYLSIFGKGFGTTKGSLDKVTIGGKEVVEYIQWGAPSRVYESHGIQVISVRIGSAITGLNQPIVVTVNSEASNSNHTFSVRPGIIYYVKPNGSDLNNGLSIASAFTTPNTCESVMDDTGHSGDHCMILGGTYDIDNSYALYTEGLIGSATDYFAFIGMPGENPIFDRSTGSQEIRLTGSGITASNYIIIANLQIDGNGGSQVQMRDGVVGSSFRFVNMDTYGMRGSSGGTGGFAVKGNGVKILGNSIHDQGCSKLYHNVYAGKFAKNLEIGWNHIYNNDDYCGTEVEKGGRAIQIHEDSDDGTGNRFENIIIHDNVIHDIAREGITLSRWVKTQEFYNNIVYRTGIREGSGWRSKAYDSCTSVTVYNNIFYDNDIANKGTGHISINLNELVPECYTFKNNIVYSTHGEPYYEWRNPDQEALTVRSNNLFFGAGSIPPGEISSVNADVKFVDPTNPARNFHLQLGSPAIDAGFSTSVARDMDGTLRPQGGAYDIGAYEYCSSNCPVADAMPPSKPKALAVK